MNLSKKATVIVSIYKNLDSLELVLLALAAQTVSSFEVIISEDNNSEKLRSI